MSVRKNILAGWTAHLITVLIGFFLMPYILGTVGEAQYGAWVFINAIAGYSGVLYSGFGATVVRFAADLSARRNFSKLNAVMSNVQLVYFGTASAVMLLSGFFAALAPSLQQWEGVSVHEVQAAILIVGSTIALGMVGSIYGGVLVGTQRLDVKRGIEVGVGLVRLAVTLACLTERLGLITLALTFLLVTILEHGLSAWFAYRQIPELRVRFWEFDRPTMKECFGFSALNAVALLAEYMIYFTDTVVIGLILGPRAVVPYQIGLRITQMIQVPIAQIGEAVLPKAGELQATENFGKLGPLVTKGMGLALLLAGGFAIGGWYFGDLLIRTWIGEGYAVSRQVLVILLGAQIVALPMVVARKALLGTGQIRLQVVIDLIEALVNLALSLILIRRWGIIGVAWGTFMPLTLIELFVLLPNAAKVLHLRIDGLWRNTIAPQIPPFVALLVVCEVVSPHVPETGWIPLILVTGLGGFALLGMRYLMYRLEDRDLRPKVLTSSPSQTTPVG